MRLRGLSLLSFSLILFPAAEISFSQSNRAGAAATKYSVDQQVQDFGRLANAQPMWAKDCKKTNATPVIAGDQVILLERLTREEERVRCFRLSNGESLWEHRYPAPLPSFFDEEFGWGPHSTPALHDGKVITIGTTGIAWAIDLATGRTRWRRDLWKEFGATPLERGFAASPVIESNRLIIPVGGAGSGLVALDGNSGRTLWASTDFASAYTSPVAGEIEGQRQVVVLMKDVLSGIDPSNGRVLWQTPFETPNSVHVASPLLIEQQYVLAGSSGGTRLFRVTKQSQGWNVEQVWRTSRSAPQIGNYIRVNDQVIAPASGGTGSFTTCLNWKDGSLVWTERFGGRGSVFQLRDGLLTVADTGDLEVRRMTATAAWEAFRYLGFAVSPQWSAPAFGKGVMVLQSGDRLQAWRLGNRQ